LEPGELGLETLSQAEGRAEVVIESEPSGAAQTLFEQRDGKWVGSVEGSEMELTMQDEQVLSSVLALELGDPAIINTAEGFNQAGDPVTWTAIYERTDAGIMTTHREEPREIPQGLEVPVIDEDDVFAAPELTLYSRPESPFEIKPAFGVESDKETPPTKGRLWFEQASDAEDETEADAKKDTSVIDFFSKGQLFKSESAHDNNEPATIFQSEARVKDQDEAKGDVIEAAFGISTAAEVNEGNNETITSPIEDEVPSVNNVVELFVGEAKLVDEPTSLAQTEVTDTRPESAQEASEVSGQINTVIEEPTEDQVDAVGEEFEPSVIEAPEAPIIIDSEATKQILAEPEPVALDGELAIETAAKNTLEQEAVTPHIQVEAPPTAQVGEQPEALTDVPITEVPAESEGLVDAIQLIEPELEVIVPAAEILPSAEEITTVPEPLAVAEKIESAAADEAIDQVLRPQTPDEAAVVRPEPQPVLEALEQTAETARESIPAAILSPESEPISVVDETQNVIKLEITDPEELDLGTSDWAAEFGAPAPITPEPEPVFDTPEPKREVLIRRHESGLLDITVTFESESEETDQTRTKKTAAKTMRRAA
jgi:hypothetical protein